MEESKSLLKGLTLWLSMDMALEETQVSCHPADKLEWSLFIPD